MELHCWTWSRDRGEKPRPIGPGLFEGGGIRRELQGGARSKCLRGARRLNRFGSASGQRHVCTSPCKGKAILPGLAVDANQVARTNLIGGQQIGKGVDHMALDSALEVTCTVTLVGPFF